MKILLALIKKAWTYWMNFKIHKTSKSRKVNKLWQKLLDQYWDNLKTRFV